MLDLEVKSALLEQQRYRLFMAQLTGQCLYEEKEEVVFTPALFPTVTGYTQLDEGTCSFTALTPTFAELDAQILDVEQRLANAFGP